MAPPPTTTTQPALCTICLTPLTNFNPSRRPFAVFPCSHVHCLACLRRNFILSMETAPPRPVQCCPDQRLATSMLRQCLSLRSPEVAAYRERLAEYDAKVKLYCHDPRCGRFIPDALRSGRVGKCRGCYGKTCVECRGRAHLGRCEDHLDEVEDGSGMVKARRPVRWGDEVRFKKTAREMGW
ncbi:alcohol-sensitive RING finger protein 1 [Achaetomium macrosporum]|uniref:Alcohol-sensitive RING finger protein 1 n=1 Tax=Achaetomium macrosporum TaxID=79813 RepID=A0AAN7CEQ3_9PEZI|nr:alcohol-sensitive RING finger protein 1 [Achaetomium macrosporum]